MRKLIILLLILIGTAQISKAQNDIPPITLSDTARISLLTSTPWDGAIYALFGHTAIRINDPVNNIDYVFNYGIFNFDSPNFIMRFVKGETDYIVAAVDYQYYLNEYKQRGVGVVEQVFNLSSKEKQDIFNALLINSLPENRVYRYNYFYDNCSTRPRDIIEKYIDGHINYVPTNEEQTYRDLVWECTNIKPWAKFGIDLVIGADADKVITDRQKDFLPVYLMNAFNYATVVYDNGIERELLLETTDTFIAKPLVKDNILSPLYAGIILLIITVLLSLLIYKKQLIVLGKIFDTILFLAAGLGGVVIFFLMFFSEHPCVNPNWNIVWLNPLQLIVAFLFFVKPLSKVIYCYHFINFAALLIFLLAWSLIPQKLEIAFIPFILSIMIRSGMNILQQRKLKKKAEYSLPRIRR